jgi:kanamycin kinase
MKKTIIDFIPEELPSDVLSLTRGARIFDSSCSPEARVYFIDRDGGYYLKLAERETLAREAQMTEYFYKKGLGTEVMLYEKYERDVLITRAVRGEDLTHAMYLSEPERLAETIGMLLRELHEVSAPDCPVTDRMGEYFALAEKNYLAGSYDATHFPDSFGYRSAEEAWRVLVDGRAELKNEGLLHGDYCLPNVMLDGWRFSAYIDLGNAGIGDRHVDLFWGAWTLGFNLGTDRYRDIFFDAYGRDKIDFEKLKIVAAAEVFG